jgi:hypothetical protein
VVEENGERGHAVLTSNELGKGQEEEKVSQAVDQT